MLLVQSSFYKSLTYKPADMTLLVPTKEQQDEGVSSPRQEPVTVYAHDRKFLLALYKIPIRGFLIVAFLHFYMKSTKTLLLQSIFPIKALWEANVFRVYIRGHIASKQLRRPWKQRESPRQVATKYVGYAVRVWKGEGIAEGGAAKNAGRRILDPR